MDDSAAKLESEHKKPEERFREVRFRHSTQFLPILKHLGASLLVSTYAAGKVAAIGVAGEELKISFHNFERAMGVAVGRKQIAVGALGQIWFLNSGGELARRIEPVGQHDACYLARTSFATGKIHVHEMVWGKDGQLWVVNTLFSCISTLHEDFSFVPRWQPPFISELQAQDRCHLNGMAFQDGRPKYATMMAESNEPGGWRPNKNSTGLVMDIPSGEVVTLGLAMPHSPRIYRGRLWVLNSGCGALEHVDLGSGTRDIVTTVPGYTRGLAMHGQFAFVGLSRIRETAVFGGVPIAERRDDLKCGVAVVDLEAGRAVAYIEFETGVEEVFDVQVLPGIRCVSLTGPFPEHDGSQDVWVVPNPTQIDHLIAPGQAGWSK